jgi:WD40 repeat protein
VTDERTVLGNSSGFVAAFSRDGRRLLLGLSDGRARVYDADTLQPLAPALPQQGTITCAAFSPDGTRIITGSRDRTARVCDTDTGALMAPVVKHQEALLSVCFSPDGRLVATTTTDGRVRVWDARTADPVSPYLSSITGLLSDETPFKMARRFGIWQMSEMEVYLRAQRAPRAVLFSSDNRQLIALEGQGMVRVWDLEPGRRPAEGLIELARLLGGQRPNEKGDMAEWQPADWRAAWKRLADAPEHR